MEPSLPETQNLKPWNQVTPLSKYLAMAIFILMPFIGGYIGYTYAPEKVVEVEKNVIQNKEPSKEISNSQKPNVSEDSTVTYTNSTYGFSIQYPAWWRSSLPTTNTHLLSVNGYDIEGSIERYDFALNVSTSTYFGNRDTKEISSGYVETEMEKQRQHWTTIAGRDAWSLLWGDAGFSVYEIHVPIQEKDIVINFEFISGPMTDDFVSIEWRDAKSMIVIKGTGVQDIVDSIVIF